MRLPAIPFQADPVIQDDLVGIVDTCLPLLGQLSGRSVMITGGSGFVGRYLVETVLLHNAADLGPPCTLTLPTRQPDILRARYQEQVDTAEVVVLEWGEGYSIEAPRQPWDYVIHAAAPADPRSYLLGPDRSLRELMGMSASVAAAAKASGSRRLLLLSSGAVYGNQPAGIMEIPEDYLGAPDTSKVASLYGEGKRISELLFRLSGVDQRAARIFSLIGPYQDLTSSFAVPDLIRQAASKGALELTGDGSAVRNYCYAADLTVFLFKLLLGHPKYDAYNVGSREGTITIGDVARSVSDIFGGLEITRRGVVEPPARQSRYVPQLDRMYEVDSPRVGVREGLLRTCHSLFNRGLIERKPIPDLN